MVSSPDDIHSFGPGGCTHNPIGPRPDPTPTPEELAEIERTLIVVDTQTGGRKGQKLAQFSQIPPDVLHELAEHFGKGMAKYPDEGGRPNWQRGYSWRLSVDAMGRHLNAWLQGEDMDPETGTSHLVCAIWHLMVLRWFQLHGVGRDFRETK